MAAATTSTIDPEEFEFECTFPGCAKRYARKDAVKKHAKEKHHGWEMLSDSRKRGSQSAFCRQVACVSPSVQRVEAVAEQPDAKKQKVPAPSCDSTNSCKEVKNDSEDDDCTPPMPELNQSDIKNWKERDVIDWIIFNNALPADVASCRSWGDLWDATKPEKDQSAELLRFAEIVFQNAYGRSPKLRVSIQALKLRVSSSEEGKALLKVHAEHVAGLMVRAHAGRIAAAACRNVVKKYPCGREKQLLQKKFLKLSAIAPGRLSQALDALLRECAFDPHRRDVQMY